MARLGAKLGLTAMEAAWGVHAVVCEAMAGAARVHLVEKGRDPRRYAMVAFGGAGPAHAVRVARILGIGQVLVPPASGAASALGFLAAPLAFETSRSLIAPLGRRPLISRRSAPGWLGWKPRRATSCAPPASRDAAMRVERSAEMRLVGQFHQITVPLPDGGIEAARLPDIRAGFVETYQRLYTRVVEGAEIELLSLRVRVLGPEPEITVSGAVGAAVGDGAALKGSRRAWFDGAFHDAPVYDRYRLKPGDSVPGPAIIEEREATTIIAPGDTLAVDAVMNLRIAVGATAKAEALVTPGMALEVAKARIEADPIGLEIMWSRLISIVEEMWQTVCRTAYSLIIAEAQDFANEILDPQGNPLAHSPRAMPLFNLTLTRCVKALLEHFPADTLKPGDVLVTNDPWLCAGHLFDIALVTPVFHEGRVVALMGTVGHVSDIGGVKDPLAAREIYDEGFQIPPMKIYEAGVPDRSLFRLMAQNIRNSDQVLGDVESMVTANALGGAAAGRLHGGIWPAGPRRAGRRGAGRAARRRRARRSAPCPMASMKARSRTARSARRCATSCASTSRARPSMSSMWRRRRRCRVAA